MVKITKANRQFRVNIPQEIIDMTGWDESTEILFVPYIQDPKSELNKNTPILIMEFTTKRGGKKK